MDYNKIVSDLRELARDLLRLKMINGLRTSKLKFETDKKDYEKQLAVLKYELDDLDESHPNYAEIKENKDKDIKCVSDLIESISKSLGDIDENINDITSGKTKVSASELECETDKLIGNHITQKARDLE